MAELLLEILSEEIPARMQAQAARDLHTMMVGALQDAGYAAIEARAFATPRRLAVQAVNLPALQPDHREERKGPRVNAPDAAIQGFIKSAGIPRQNMRVQNDPKGDFYVALIERKGQPTAQVIAGIVPAILRSFPWPKSMRWGNSTLVWVRPIHSILCVFDGKPVVFDVDAVRSGDETRGHRFMGNDTFRVRSFIEYEQGLRQRRVLLDSQERAKAISAALQTKAIALGLKMIEDEALLAEVAGLVEWPVVLTGKFDPAFLEVPAEVLTSTMRSNQKYFAFQDSHGRLANQFALAANMVTGDGGRAVVAGNERVLKARLSDAKFFWDQDLKVSLESRVPQLRDVIFHAQLGSQYDRVIRIETLAGQIADMIGADAAKARRAARLCKADLLTGTVGEFPEVQGAAGRYLARLQGEDREVADAIRDHYRPQGPGDAVPTHPVSIAVALADKLDILAGFWAIDEKPTGSKDPFALRRAALGVVRIILENSLRLRMRGFGSHVLGIMRHLGKRFSGHAEEMEHAHAAIDSILEFFADRIAVALKDRGVRHDLIAAVFASNPRAAEAKTIPRANLAAQQIQDDLLLIVKRVEALQAFLGTGDGANLLAGYKRAANILRAERKKERDEMAFMGTVNMSLLKLPEEVQLQKTLSAAQETAGQALQKEDFAGVMRTLALLRPAVDAFFDRITVNDPSAALRQNRLTLLSQFPQTLAPIADFAKIEG